MPIVLLLSLLFQDPVVVQDPVLIQDPPILIDAFPPESVAAVDTPIVPPAQSNDDLPEPTAPPKIRILDLVTIDGMRDNQLIGLGVVVGLEGTGDSGVATRQALSNFIRQFGINVGPKDVSSGNVALVSVTATLEPFLKTGTRIDIRVSSIGASKSLFGGNLLQTPLRGADANVYAVAQGPVLVGGFAVSGQSASVTRNHPTVGLVAGGGLIEREVPMSVLSPDGSIHLQLKRPSFLTAHRISEELNRRIPGAARALDAATVRLEVPADRRTNIVGLLAELGEETVTPGVRAVVVINERTGTIVAGNEVRISTAAITHGDLTIAIAESDYTSQPRRFSRGETTTEERTSLVATVEQREMTVIPSGTTVHELADSLNRLGVSSRDLVVILQALKRQGALHAELEIM